MKLIQSTARGPLRGARFIAALAGFSLIASLPAAAGSKEPIIEEEELEEEPGPNWIEMSLGGISVDDNDAAYQARHQNNGDAFGGIESFRFEQMTDNGNLLLEGRAMFGLEDYMLRIRYDRDDIGYVEAGYREFRNWYDGSGGWLPGTDITPPGWVDPITYADDEYHLDRGAVWFEAGLRMEDLPAITFGYEHRWRDGMKDSTIWEDDDLWGPIGDPQRVGYVPAFYDIDETSDIFRLDIDYTVRITELALTMRYQMDDSDNTRQEVRQTDPEVRDYWDSDLFSSSLTSTTRFNDKMILTFGYLFTDLDTDVDGSLHDEDVFIFGGSDATQHVTNLGFWWNPVEDVVVVPSIRAEWQDIDAETTERDSSGDIVRRGVQNSSIDYTETTEEIEVRYTGFSNMLLYARTEWMQSDKDQRAFELERNTRWTDVDTDRGKYMIGANLYPKTGLSVSAQYFYRTLDQDFDHNYDVLPGDNPGLDGQLYSHGSDTHDANIRLTWRVRPNLTLVTRYDYQDVTIDNQGYFWDGVVLSPTRSIDSADITRHVLSESITWNPTERLYLQGNLSWISSETDTPADSGINGIDPGLVPDYDNDYWNMSLNAGYAIDKRTALHFGASYYSADNFTDNTPVGTPYGTDAEEYALTVRLTRQIRYNMIWNAGYGYFHGSDNAYGGYNDYDAHVVSTGFRYRF